MRRTLVTSVPVLLALLAVGAAVARPAMRAGATSINIYAPFSGSSVAPDIRIEKTISGSCWTTSIADSRSTAFRCMSGNAIYDPCFAPSTGVAHYVLCPQYPVAPVLRIHLTKRLPSNPAGGNPTRFPPWALQTSSGKWCTMITGATGLIAGKRMSYGCTGGGILAGNPNRKTKVWTIFYAPSYKAKHVQTVGLRSAWW